MATEQIELDVPKATPNNVKPETDPWDGKERYDCLTKYPEKINFQIKWEAIYLVSLLIINFLLFFFVWNDWVGGLLKINDEKMLVFKSYSYFALSGMLGGITFGMKFFYRVVARGFWHQDRIYWRLLSPIIGSVISLIVGAMINSGLLNTGKSINSSSILAIGFFAGYFADEAVGKMYDVASVIFGNSSLSQGRNKSDNEKK